MNLLHLWNHALQLLAGANHLQPSARVGKSRIIRRADLASAGIGGGANASSVVKNIDVTNRAGLRAGIGESTSGGWTAGKRFAGTSHAPAHQTRSNLKEN